MTEELKSCYSRACDDLPTRVVYAVVIVVFEVGHFIPALFKDLAVHDDLARGYSPTRPFDVFLSDQHDDVISVQSTNRNTFIIYLFLSYVYSIPYMFLRNVFTHLLSI